MAVLCPGRGTGGSMWSVGSDAMRGARASAHNQIRNPNFELVNLQPLKNHCQCGISAESLKAFRFNFSHFYTLLNA